MAGEGLAAARAAFIERRWRAAGDLYAQADPAGADDLERWGLAALLIGRDGESDAARERAHHAYRRAGRVEDACRAAFWLGLALTLRGEHARGAGWFARVRTVLDEHPGDSVWHGFLLVPRGMEAFFKGDLPTALDHADQAVAFSERYRNPDLAVLAHNARGQALVGSGEVELGLAELDEVMVLVTTAEDVSPQLTGLVYCAVIETCRDAFDVRRGREWTAALSRWCAAQPDLVPYRGQCTVHRAEILRLTGSWTEAATEIDHAETRAEDPATGMALYQRGELHRLRGDFAASEAAYEAALQVGHDPQPGLGLLRVAQNRVDVALAAVRRALDEVSRSSLRLRLLPSYVEIALAGGDGKAARTAAEELQAAANHRAAPLLQAAALHASGAVDLADDPAKALTILRKAWAAWQDIPAPYDAARCRVLIALACRSLGDDDTAELELLAARWVFDQLGAVPDVAAVDRLAARPAADPRPGGLTLREVEVLRAVATGATNRSIAQTLFLSEKTVARHVANIFRKLGVTSRSAATAFAYRHDLA
ncbi:helix-turn-helix transcriptional regulator [Amycolatopsis jejuensis]|uniref:helix-turn-helix transcriptional regulator n=1 Tax=Amycolatopsis jejuensis TaxID=330084 RepID=UPI00052495F3|nr:LuxR C-terminal-related transcriptional regulator [Amycolatopsis jejuensis]